MTLEAEREAALDALLRPALVLDPPPEVSARLLTGVLAGADRVFAPSLSPAAAEGLPGVVPGLARPTAPSRSLPLAGYLILALLAAVYAVILGSLGGLDGAFRQVIETATLILGSPAMRVVPALADQFAEYAPWLLVLPVVWMLWERDRATLARS